jgi:uncharacterized membrane protein YkvA (DUF1232 family)
MTRLARSPSLELLAAISALSVALAACDEDKPKRPAVAVKAPTPAQDMDADAGAPKPGREVPGLLATLRGEGSLEQRSAALQRLRDLADSDSLSGVDDVDLLRAAAEEWPPLDEDVDLSAVLVDLASHNPRPTFVPVVQRVFPKLSPDAKAVALELLAKLDDDHAAAALMSLLGAHADELPAFSLEPLRDNPHHAQIFFPALLDYAARPDMVQEVWLTALIYCRVGAIGDEELAPYTAHMLEVYRRTKAKILPIQRRALRSSALTPAYREMRYLAELLLALFAYVPQPDVEPELRQALGFRDPWLLLTTALALLRRGEEVPQAVIDRVAATPETRNLLYQRLSDLDALERFPERHVTQLAFAESEMANWILDDVGCAPDEMVLGKIVSVDSDTPDGPLDFYVFRFRIRPPHWAASPRWQAGVAGPFLRKDAPTVEALGSTSSAFEAWSSRTPEEHAGDLQNAVEAYKARRAAQEEQAREAEEESAGD